MNPLRGHTPLEIGGKKRILACDMNAGEVLFRRIGAHWVLWIAERFIGRKTSDKNGKERIDLIDVSPHETVTALYAMLATDRMNRERNGEEILESEESLRELVTLANLRLVNAALTNAVLTSFYVPGEANEAAGSADGGPHSAGHAPTPGTGERL
jgi:hypothetical protein